MNLPVEAQFSLVVHLGSVHAEVVLAIRILGDHQRSVTKCPPSMGHVLGWGVWSNRWAIVPVDLAFRTFFGGMANASRSNGRPFHGLRF